jgi:hypothetical protein
MPISTVPSGGKDARKEFAPAGSTPLDAARPPASASSPPSTLVTALSKTESKNYGTGQVVFVLPKYFYVPYRSIPLYTLQFPVDF